MARYLAKPIAFARPDIAQKLQKLYAWFCALMKDWTLIFHLKKIPG